MQETAVVHTGCAQVLRAAFSQKRATLQTRRFRQSNRSLRRQQRNPGDEF
jgi:hypothetical protein